MQLSELLAPTYRQMLSALSTWLEKAAEFKGGAADADDLMAARLAADMFPLATQVRFACVQALEGMARLTGQPVPEAATILLDEGRNAGERPGTIADARGRIAQTITAIHEASLESAVITPEAPLAHALPQGMVFDFTGGQYVRDWALPQFYFHLMTAYAILRAEGVPLGKADFVAHLFSCIRPGTMPTE